MDSAREPTIVRETKIISKIHTVRRPVHADQMRAIKGLVEQFMRNGVSEYRMQQQHWTELYEEQVEDMIDLQKKMDALEEVVRKLEGSSSESESSAPPERPQRQDCTVRSRPASALSAGSKAKLSERSGQETPEG